ncbi:MAG: DUF3991 and TOPRIM domain-containing protein [Eubacteriales bacterium]
MNVTKEQIEQAKQVDLLSYLQSYEPTNLVRKGCDYCTKEHDSLIISPNGLWHWKSRDVGGKTALQYLLKVKRLEFVDAVLQLCNRQPVLVNEYFQGEETEKQFILPEPYMNNNKVIMYLKNRGLSRDVIDYCINHNLIYESEDYHNAVFVGYDGAEPKYAALRGTYNNSSNQFKGEVHSSNKRFSFSIKAENKSNKLIISESAIDVLSVATIRNNIGKVHYLSIGGAYAPKSNIANAKMPMALEQYLSDYEEIQEIELCLDNDKVGIGASFFLMQRLMGRGYVIISCNTYKEKDYNEYLNNIEKISKSCYNK